MYFTVPAGEVLYVHRERVFPWAYGHMLIFGSIAATGAGLHVAAYYIGHEANIGATATVLTVAARRGFRVRTFAPHAYLLHSGDPFPVALLAGTAAILALAVLLASGGLPMAVCLVVLMLAPLVTVVGYETVGHRHLTAALNRAFAA
jgi:low temperature requirement protein LtrA